MTRCITLFLIRHGETVDNVAGLYAGSRDSELTNHGYQQATRLGLHFKSLGLTFTHVFSSQLQRAVKTAGRIREAQLASHGEDGNARIAPEVVQLPILMEQDFGSMEGKKFFERAVETKTTDKEHNRTPNKNSGAFVDAEPKEVMARRADRFLDDHIWPLLHDDAETADPVVAIVSHGIFLSTLWKRLLLRLPGKSVALTPELQATARPSLEHLGGWSNTGYLGLQMLQDKREELELKELEPSRDVLGSPIQSAADDMKSAKAQGQGKVVLPQSVESGDSTAISSTGELRSPPTTPSRQPSTAKLVQGWTTTIRTINGKDHLKRLKRTGGGVGSSRHDASQKSIETFFKRRKTE